ncbi:MAG TPA: hypothetical protein VEV43_09705 [Actinomycetota bacterium]|nr:hypothetical protein [Actinomycetota bacterium]
MPNDETEAAATPAPEPMADPGLSGLYGRGTKKKVSLTLDESLLLELRVLAGNRPLSTAVNDLLEKALAQHRLNELVDELIAEAGEPPPEVYEQILDEWDQGVKQRSTGRHGGASSS